MGPAPSSHGASASAHLRHSRRNLPSLCLEKPHRDWPLAPGTSTGTTCLQQAVQQLISRARAPCIPSWLRHMTKAPSYESDGDGRHPAVASINMTPDGSSGPPRSGPGAGEPGGEGAASSTAGASSAAPQVLRRCGQPPHWQRPRHPRAGVRRSAPHLSCLPPLQQHPDPYVFSVDEIVVPLWKAVHVACWNHLHLRIEVDLSRIYSRFVVA